MGRFRIVANKLNSAGFGMLSRQKIKSLEASGFKIESGDILVPIYVKHSTKTVKGFLWGERQADVSEAQYVKVPLRGLTDDNFDNCLKRGLLPDHYWLYRLGQAGFAARPDVRADIISVVVPLGYRRVAVGAHTVGAVYHVVDYFECFNLHLKQVEKLLSKFSSLDKLKNLLLKQAKFQDAPNSRAWTLANLVPGIGEPLDDISASELVDSSVYGNGSITPTLFTGAQEPEVVQASDHTCETHL